MKKTVWTFGLISGAICSLMVLLIGIMGPEKSFESGMFVGFTSMILAFSLVFFGIRSYRDNILNRTISFGKAFKVGILITVISSLCYVFTWAIVYKTMVPDFMEKFSAYQVSQIDKASISQTEFQEKIDEINYYKELYKNPFIFFLMTFSEIFPVGLVITLVSALILKRKTAPGFGNESVA